MRMALKEIFWQFEAFQVLERDIFKPSRYS